MKLTLLTALLAVSLSSNAFAVNNGCPDGKPDPTNPAVCMKDPSCTPCPEGWFFKHPKNEAGHEKAACVQCASDYIWDVTNKKCARKAY